MGDGCSMYVAWTTVAQQADAEALAKTIVSLGLVVCVQIEGPIISYYRWEGRLERAEEYRLAFKFTANRLDELERYVFERHPYDTPEWIVVRAERVGEKYLSWANTNSTNPPL
jgi:periplasmic divalent cation tolerance protein